MEIIQDPGNNIGHADISVQLHLRESREGFYKEKQNNVLY